MDKQTPDERRKVVERAIEAAGGAPALAKALGVDPQHIWNWRQRGFPAHRCVEIEALTGGKVTCHEMRPDIFGPPPAKKTDPRLRVTA